MLRYRGFVSWIVKIAVIGGLVVGTNYISEEYELSLPKQIAKLQQFRENKIITANNEISIGRYRDCTGKMKQIHTDIKKTTSITLDNRDNFLGFMGQTINKYKLNVGKITYVNIEDYVTKNVVTKPQDKVDEKYKVYDAEIKKNILKDTVGLAVEKKEGAGYSPFKEKQEEKPQIDNTKMNGIIVDISGDTNLYNFMLDLEKYNFRYLVAGLETDKETSTVRLIIDLR